MRDVEDTGHLLAVQPHDQVTAHPEFGGCQAGVALLQTFGEVAVCGIEVVHERAPVVIVRYVFADQGAYAVDMPSHLGGVADLHQFVQSVGYVLQDFVLAYDIHGDV